jgi:hypothetical protein
VVLSAFVPTIISQQLFQPRTVDVEEEEALGAEDVSVIHHSQPPPRSPRLAVPSQPSPDGENRRAANPPGGGTYPGTGP